MKNRLLNSFVLVLGFMINLQFSKVFAGGLVEPPLPTLAIPQLYSCVNPHQSIIPPKEAEAVFFKKSQEFWKYRKQTHKKWQHNTQAIDKLSQNIIAELKEAIPGIKDGSLLRQIAKKVTASDTLSFAIDNYFNHHTVDASVIENVRKHGNLHRKAECSVMQAYYSGLSNYSQIKKCLIISAERALLRNLQFVDKDYSFSLSVLKKHCSEKQIETIHSITKKYIEEYSKLLSVRERLKRYWLSYLKSHLSEQTYIKIQTRQEILLEGASLTEKALRFLKQQGKAGNFIHLQNKRNFIGAGEQACEICKTYLDVIKDYQVTKLKG